MKKTASSLLLLSLSLLLAACGGKDRSRLAAKGVEALNEGNPEKARNLLGEALADVSPDPSQAPAWQALGMACWQLGEAERAEEALKQSVILQPDAAQAHLQLGQLLIERGSLPEAQRVLITASLLSTNGIEALELLAATALNQQRLDEARRFLHQALQRETTPRLLTALAMATSAPQSSERSLHYLRQALKLDPDYAPAHYNLAVIYDLGLKRPEPAVEHYKAFLKLQPQSPNTLKVNARLRRLTQATEVRPTPQGATGNEALRLPESATDTGSAAVTPPAIATPVPIADPAAARVDSMLRVAKGSISTGNSTRALNLCFQASAYAARKNRADLQEKAVEAAVILCPKQPRAHFAHGQYLNDLNRHRDAMQAFLKAAELKPDWIMALQAAADAAVEADEIQIALRTLRQAVQAAPDNADLLHQLGTFCMDVLGVKESAVNRLEEFEKLFPEDPRIADVQKRLEQLKGTAPSTENPEEAADEADAEEAAEDSVSIEQRQKASELYSVGAVHHSNGALDRALAYYHEAILANPRHAKACFNLALILHERGKLDEARDLYTRAIEIKPDNSQAMLNLATILGATEEGKAEARRLLERVLTIQPEGPVADAAQRWLTANP